MWLPHLQTNATGASSALSQSTKDKRDFLLYYMHLFFFSFGILGRGYHCASFHITLSSLPPFLPLSFCARRKEAPTRRRETRYMKVKTDVKTANRRKARMARASFSNNSSSSVKTTKMLFKTRAVVSCDMHEL